LIFTKNYKPWEKLQRTHILCQSLYKRIQKLLHEKKITQSSKRKEIISTLFLYCFIGNEPNGADANAKGVDAQTCVIGARGGGWGGMLKLKAMLQLHMLPHLAPNHHEL
jgi:hypothetical protein